MTEAILMVLALAGVVAFVQRSAHRRPSDAQRFEESARVARRERVRLRARR